MIKFVLAGMLAIFATTATAGVSVQGNRMFVTGDTTKLQLIMVEEILKTNDIKFVVMSGNGGDFYAGLRIGVLIRKEGARTQILSGTKCISACAFAALGGVDVWVGGDLLFHRPYLTQVPTNLTLDEVIQLSELVATDAAAYIDFMGYPLIFARDIMQHTTPCLYINVGDKGGLIAIKNGDREYQRKRLC